jgi:MerR family transcriptional regulator, heat shock protein HspR
MKVSKQTLRMHKPDANAPLYSITVAAELAGLPQATLRLYERKGLLRPERTQGGTRRYSDSDVALLIRVAQLQEAGVNLAGIGRVLELQGENDALRREIAEAAFADRDGSEMHAPFDRDDQDAR